MKINQAYISISKNKKVDIKNLPNLITGTRIILAPTLLLLSSNSVLFVLVYITACLSDMMDGYLARRMKTTSDFGATLDSVADFLFVIIMLIIMIPLIELSLNTIMWISGITVIRVTSLIVGYIRHRKLAFLHTYANKATGLVLISIPILFNIIDLDILMFIICILASLSAIEELIINLTVRQLKRNIKWFMEV